MSTLEILGLFLSTIFIIYYATFSRRKGGKNYPPGPSNGVPIFGNALSLIAPFREGTLFTKTFNKFADECGPITMLKVPHKNIVIINEANIVREAFSNPALNGRPDIPILKTFSGGEYGIVMAQGKNYAEQKIFTMKTLKKFGFEKERMETLVQHEADELIKLFEKKSANGDSFDPSDDFSMPSINPIWTVMTGKRFNLEDEEAKKILRDFFSALDDATFKSILGALPEIVVNLFPNLSGFNDYKKVMDETHRFFLKIIKDHQSERTSLEAMDFIDAYSDEIKKNEDDPNSNFNTVNGYKNLIAIMTDFFTGGGETTAITLTWSLLYLGLNQDVQKKLQNEIDEVIGNSRLPSLKDRPNMPYSEAVIHEIFRRSSIASIVTPHACIEDTKLSGYDIPKGAIITSLFHRIHHNERDWESPYEFRPERFLNEDRTKFSRSELVIPFSVGKRACMGESAAKDMFFILLLSIYQKFNIKLDERAGPLSTEPRVSFIDRPQNFKVFMTHRHKCLN